MTSRAFIETWRLVPLQPTLVSIPSASFLKVGSSRYVLDAPGHSLLRISCDCW